MSCAVLQTLSEASGVDFVFPFAVARGPANPLGEPHVCVVRTATVELLRICGTADSERLQHRCTLRLFAKVEGAATCALPRDESQSQAPDGQGQGQGGCEEDVLVLQFGGGRLSVLSFEYLTNAFRTLSSHMLSAGPGSGSCAGNAAGAVERNFAS